MRKTVSKFKELKDFDRQVLDWIVESAKGHSKECILSAVNHLKMAYKIKNIDPEISWFRCITAEEEVARAIFLILKEHKYTNVNKLKDKDHKYKQALDLFIVAIQNHFASFSKDETFPKDIRLFLNKENKKLEIQIVINDIAMTSIPPLNFSMVINGKSYYFSKELQDLATQNDKKILKQIEEKANFRNKIIYAEQKGILKVTGDISVELDKYYNRVFKLIRIYSLIYPYKNEKSEFIQNSLDAFLFMMADMDV